MPKVTVIIPAFNRRHFLNEAIQSVLDQTFQNFDIIVVDDGSTDNTKEAVESFKDPRIKYIYQENRGVAAARNTGIKASSGEHVAFLDSDDMWLPQNLELKVNLLDSDPHMGIVCSDAYKFDNQTGAIIRRVWQNNNFLGPFDPRTAPRNALTRFLSRGCFIKGSTPLVRRSAFSHVGLFDESLKSYSEDWDMWARVLLYYGVGTIDMPLVKCRRHGANVTADRERTSQGWTVVLNKAIQTYPLSPTNLRVVKRRLAQHHHTYGTQLVLDNRINSGRKQFIAAIRVDPCFLKPYIYLVASFLGKGAVIAIQSGKRLVGRWFTGHKPSGNAHSMAD